MIPAIRRLSTSTAALVIGIGLLSRVALVWLAERNASVCTCDESDDCTCGGAWGDRR